MLPPSQGCLPAYGSAKGLRAVACDQGYGGQDGGQAGVTRWRTSQIGCLEIQFNTPNPIRQAGDWRSRRKGKTQARLVLTCAEPVEVVYRRAPVLHSKTQARCLCYIQKHRQDACATVGETDETSGENTGKMPVLLLERRTRRPGRTQARCLCYCPWERRSSAFAEKLWRDKPDRLS